LPKIIQFQFPKAKQEVKVITHNVTAAIHSLLSDKELMKAENLIFRNNSLEDPTVNDKKIIKDVNDGECYKTAYTHYCSNKEKDVLCPLILFVDKTHTDAKGNLPKNQKQRRSVENYWVYSKFRWRVKEEIEL
jgi:hypothetical protein